MCCPRSEPDYLDIVSSGSQTNLDRVPQQNKPTSGDPSETGKVLKPPPELPPLPTLPQAPTNSFSREEILSQILDLTDQIASTALFGSIGVGKSSVALTLLHHERTKAKYGGNRHFMRCDDLSNSLDGFLERLSDTIGTSRITDIEQLRSHLESSPPLILLLDGADAILDPLTPGAEDFFTALERFGCCQHVCLLTTSRIYPEIPGFHRLEVPTLSRDEAQDAFYGLCRLGRSSVIDELISRFDFHPLSIDLLATAVRENGWDESTLAKVWDDDQENGMKTRYQQRLKDIVEPSFHSPTIQHLGTAARDVLEAIAAYPCGVEVRKLERIFPSITGVGVAVDVLCGFSLLYRQDGFVKMLSPFRFYFLDSAFQPAQYAEVIRWDADCHPAEAGTFFSHHPCYGRGVTLFEVLPIYTRGPPICGSSQVIQRRRGVSAREDWIKRFKSLKKSGHNNSDTLRPTPLIAL